MKKLLTLLAFAAFAVGCRAQLPSTSPKANLTWPLPSGCTSSSPCLFAISRIQATSATCPPTTGTAYTLLVTTESQATSYVDSTVKPGLSYCFIAQTQQGNGISVPSNAVFLQIPQGPFAPTLTAN